MLSTSNLLSRTIICGINSYVQNITQVTAARAYHIIMNSISPSSIIPKTSIEFNQPTISSSIELGLTSKLLPSFNPILTQVAGFKVKGRLRRRCKDCYFVMRQQRLYVICKTHPRHKQMALKARDYKSWILTDATQSKIRPY